MKQQAVREKIQAERTKNRNLNAEELRKQTENNAEDAEEILNAAKEVL